MPPKKLEEMKQSIDAAEKRDWSEVLTTTDAVIEEETVTDAAIAAMDKELSMSPEDFAKTNKWDEPTTSVEPSPVIEQVKKKVADAKLAPYHSPIKPREEQLKQGYKDDRSKVRYELLPPEFLHAVSMVLTKGAEKYDDRNWEKGLLYSRCFGAAMRHLWAWWGGKLDTNENFAFGDLDPEWSYPHLWHAGCCVAFLISYEARRMTTFDDRPATTGDVV